MKNLLKISSLFFAIAFIFSCSKQTEVLDDSIFGYNYYPVAIGKVWEYRMDSILFDTVQKRKK